MEELKKYFEEHGISIEAVADRTNYTPNYIRNLLNGSDKINDKAIYRLGRAFPDVRPILEAAERPANGNAHPAPADAA